MKRCTANWKNANEYPPVGCQEYEWLAWEFLRRNKNYAEHFKAISHLKPGEFEKGISPDSDSLLSATECVPPAMDGETAVAYSDRMRREGVKRWRISKPKILFTERWLLAKPVVNGDQKARKYGGRCWKSDLRWGIVQGGVGRSPEGDWKHPLERGTDVRV